MLFPYTYVPHQMDKMQSYIDFIFENVWSMAPTNGPFGLNLFDAHGELRELMELFLWSDSKGAEFFYGHVERIHGLFAQLPAADIQQIRRWYQGNNDLERACANDPAVELGRYADFPARHEKLIEELASFFKGLYSQALLDLAIVRQKIGDIDSHYLAFMSTNRSSKCPFCGLSDLLGEYHTRREAYDHYLPKAIYPFNSINFKNLVPACHHCNSSYKGAKDLAYRPKDPMVGVARRKVFFPFSAVQHEVELKVALRHADIERLDPQDIQLTFGPAAIAEEIETWKAVYGIDERYRAKLCSSDGRAWVQEVLDEWRWHDEFGGAAGRTPDAYLQSVARHAVKAPHANVNFLKNSFLQGCKAAGLFDTAKQVGAPP